MASKPKKPPSRYLVWVDIETSGLDPEREAIMEIALVVTSDTLRTIEEYTIPVRTHGMYLDGMDPFVRDMHTRNGLLADLAAGKGQYHGDVEAKLLDVLYAYEETTDREKFPLCGSSVHFDRAFLKKWMPNLEKQFSHRHIDVSSFKECAKRWNPRSYDIVNGSAHRALADIRDSIEALREMRRRYWTTEPS